jgi:hypothetical protein
VWARKSPATFKVIRAFFEIGAGEEIRTLDIDLGKVTEDVNIRAREPEISPSITSHNRNRAFFVDNSVDFVWKFLFSKRATYS